MDEQQQMMQLAAQNPALMQQFLQQQQQQAAMMAAMNQNFNFAGGSYNPLSMQPGLMAGGGPNAGMMSNSFYQLQQQQMPGQQGWIGDMTGRGDPYAENGILGPWSATSAGLLGKMVVNDAAGKGKKARKKPKDRPKRPLSAYNIFFKEERARILEKLPDKEDENNEVKEEEEEEAEAGEEKKGKKRPHGKIGFENLAKVIGQRWQELGPDQVTYYKKKAEEDMKRYKQEMETYLTKKGEGGAANKIDEDSASEEHEQTKARKKPKIEED